MIQIITPEGMLAAEVIDYSLSEPERPIRVTTEDGAVLLVRATIAAVGRATSDKTGEIYYNVQTHVSVVRT